MDMGQGLRGGKGWGYRGNAILRHFVFFCPVLVCFFISLFSLSLFLLFLFLFLVLVLVLVLFLVLVFLAPLRLCALAFPSSTLPF